MKHLTLLKKLFEEHNTPFPTPTELSTINQPTLATLLCDTTHTNNHPSHKSSSHTISTILKEIKTEIKLAENTTNIRTALSVNYSILIKSHILKTQKAILLLHSSTLSFYRKISGLCVREAKRAFSRTSRVNPLLKGKKLTKEISLYHRKTDKTEKDSKKKIEKEQIEKKKKDFEQKESERQSRKLNFLLTQTELFSHFIMHKKKEGFVYEKDSKEGGVSDTKDRLEGVNNSTHKQDPLSNSTNEQQGFNETTNEQHPFINSINKQHPFINSTDKQHPLSTNGITTTIEQHPFNNTPTDIPVIDTKSLADKEIARTQEYSSTSKKSLYTSLQQPNILTCKLKDYQLKGLNWLANLYDQGINGILADDMGLGKTVQAISFLAYLYETENITGPFLIVTPASTLHNWLQEFEKFLPSFKIVPYWGSILERKALRKNWYKSGIGITAGGVNNIKSGEGVSNSNKNNKGSKGSKGVNNSTNEQHPLSNSADKQHPVNDSSNTYHPFNNSSNTHYPFNDSTDKQHPFNDSSNTYHPLSKSTDKQHPFNDSSNTYHPLSNTNSNLHTNTFNCVVTSYQIIVTDEKYFNKVKWNYMILDEAQAIKSSTSLRWKVLLNIKCRNRLLLTGTPIQNSMQELWALLHFIMPTLFDSHDEFNDWFSKEIESSAESKKVVSKAHLQRLHLILQPFMLRREKKDVKDELGIKTEKDVFCRLSYRQRMLYYGIEDSFKSKGVLSKVYSKGVLEGRFNTEDNVGDLGGVEGGVNDRDSKLDSIKGVGVKDSGIKGVNNSTYEQQGVINSTNTLHPVTSNLDVSLFGLNTEYDNKDLDCLMNMAMQLRKVCNHPNLFEKPEVKSGFNFNKCYFIGRPYVDKGVSRIEMCLPRIVREFVEEKRRGCYSQENKTFSISHMDNTSDTSHNNTPNTRRNNNTSDISHMDNTPSTTHNNTPNTRLLDNTPNACLKNNTSNTSLNNNTPYTLLDNPTSVKRVKSSIINKEEDLKYFCKNKGYFDIRWPMKTTKDLYKSKYKDYNFIFPKVFNSNITSNFNTVNSYKEKDLLSSISKCKGVLNNNSYNNTLLDEILFNNTPLNNNTYTNTLLDNILYPNTPLYNTPYNNTPSSSLTPSLYKEYVTVPKLDTFISDSGKLWVLDGLLSKLKGEGHRVLLYFQMTKMIDLMEEYLIKKGYTYLRLDGSCKIRDRRDMVREWQSKDIFIFLLSTRAGGLGINLTAADTVIFYDSDWNPTVDQQAMDRAHRLGQTKDVTVYRLITEGTIEERIMERAMKKGEIQRMVIQGGEFQGKYL